MHQTLLKSSAAMVLALALTGCQAGNALNDVGNSISSGFGAITSGALFSDDYLSNRADTCFAQRQQLAEHGSFFDKELVVATATGAVAGGLIAALRGDEIWAGALIGGAAGLAGGYLLKMQKEGRSADSIIGQAFGDVQSENRKIDNLLTSFRSVKACRAAEGRAVQGAYNAKQIDKATAQQQMANVRAKYDQDVAKFQQLAEQISENTESYAAVYNEVAADNGAGALEVKEYRKGRRSARVTRKRPKKAAGTPQGSLQASKKSNVKKLQQECLTNVRKRDECIDEIQKAEKGSDDLELDLG